MTLDKLKNIVEAILLSAERPMKLPQIETIFAEDEDRPTRDEIRKAVLELNLNKGCTLFRIQKNNSCGLVNGMGLTTYTSTVFMET